MGVCASRRVCSRVPLAGDDEDHDEKQSEQREAGSDECGTRRRLSGASAGSYGPSLHVKLSVATRSCAVKR